MEIRLRHWLTALGVAALAHAALVTAVNLQSGAPRQDSAIVINLGEMGAPEGASGGGTGAPEPPAADPAQAQGSPDSPMPVRASVPAASVETPKLPPPLVHAPTSIDSRPKPKQKTKPRHRPTVAKALRPNSHPVAPPARRDRPTAMDRSAGLDIAAGSAGKRAGVAGQGSGAGPRTGTGTGSGGNGGGKDGGGSGTGRGSGADGKGVAHYQGRLAAWLNRHKRYPERARRLRQEGTVRVSFTIDRNGRLLSHRIVRSSGHPLLDQEIKSMLTRATPMPALPAGMSQSQLTVTVPINFSLR